MSVFIRCDGNDCDKTFGEDDRHIALNVEGPPPAPTIEVDGEYVEMIAMISDGGFYASTHFCSMACLASWAMAQHLEEANQ